MSQLGFTTTDILITVKAYPNPSKKYIESSCTAGLTRDRQWLRIHPLPFRMLENNQKFKKYQWIRAGIKKSDDSRPESHKIAYDSIQVLDEQLSTERDWEQRRRFLEPVRKRSMEEIRREQELDNISLAFFKPRSIESLTITPTSRNWTEKQLAKLQQQNFFVQDDLRMLEKVPYDFRYKFWCDEPKCKGHHSKIVDWEIYQSYRSWYAKYGPEGWEEKLRERYESDMQEKKDLHLFVGTMRAYPKSWIIIGLFYPPKVSAIQTYFEFFS
jgi:hypothetical protein